MVFTTYQRMRVKGASWAGPSHFFEDQNELAHSLKFFWSHYNIEKRYIKLSRLHIDQNWTKSRILLSFKPYRRRFREYNTITEDRISMHAFENHNELTHFLIFFWSYYNIESRYRKVRRLHLDKNWTKSRISFPLEPYLCIVGEYNMVK